MPVFAAQPAGYPKSYESVVASAKQEGRVVVYSTTDASTVSALIQDFKQVYPGIEEALRTLVDAGWTLVVATSKREDLARRIAEAKGLDRYFTVIAGADMAEQHDKAWVIGQALERLAVAGVDAAGAVMIGDRHHDVDGAALRGLKSIFVTWGYGPEAEGAPASAIAHDPAECVTLLDRLAV